MVSNAKQSPMLMFSYDWPELEELRTVIPRHCNIKEDCKIG
ncbi:hypothetical protein H5410_001839 [Solanum commersonii]|uniref:Uncharacterized protein n=1 Tax=Solanum commersonii TaxID=4109 RepID=A0A9J6B0P8_SOLCO|nr:hypothetical protein H5410_001839 [Solanum commersonii]